MPKSPDDKTPHDKTAAEIEATAIKTIEIIYAGEAYLFPASLEDCDGDVIDALDDMKISRALRSLLEPGQWLQFKATKPKLKDYGALFDAYAEKIGLGSAGN